MVGAISECDGGESPHYHSLYPTLSHDSFAPLTIPTFLSDDWRSVGIGYLKNIMVYALQGVLIFLIISLVPLFESAGKLALSNGAGVMETLATAFGGLVQAILLIIALVGSQRTARSILGMEDWEGRSSQSFFIFILDWSLMNTRVLGHHKVQHRAWLGFTTRQVIFVLPAIAITILIFRFKPLLLAIWGLVCLRTYLYLYHSSYAFWGLSP